MSKTDRISMNYVFICSYMIVDSAYPLSLWHHRGTCPAIPESNRRQKSTLRSRVPQTCAASSLISFSDFLITTPPWKAAKKIHWSWCSNPTWICKAPGKWSFKTSLQIQTVGWKMKNWWCYTPRKLTYPLQKAGWKTMFLLFRGHSFIFGRGISSKRSPLMSFKNYLMRKVLQ